MGFERAYSCILFLNWYIAILASFVNFLLPSEPVRGGLGWGKKFTTAARIAISPGERGRNGQGERILPF